MSEGSTTKPLFSVVIPVYNRSRELLRALNSVKSQSEKNFEVLVVDDGSDAEHVECMQKYIESLRDERFSMLSYPDNRNGAYARNVGIQNARGEYISFLDSDDEWLQDKLEMVKRVVESSEDACVIYHQYQDVRNDMSSAPMPKEGMRKGQTVAEYSFCQNRGGGIQSSCLTVKRGLAKQVLFNEKLKGHQDWDFALRLGDKVKDFKFIRQVFTRRHISSNTSGMVSRSLSYSFSYKFLQDYERYFSPRAKAAYAAFVLESRRLKEDPRGPFTYFQLLAWLYYPGKCFLEKRRMYLVNKRINQLYEYCRKHKLKSVCLVGYNDYAQKILSKYGDKIPVTLVIDKNKRETIGNGFKVCSVGEVKKELWENIDLVVTVTDHYHEDMRNDFAGIEGLRFYAF